MDITTEEEHRAWRGILKAQEMTYRTASSDGWYKNPETGEDVVALMHSELSEALEAYRKELMDDNLPHRNGIQAEFADCVIRILDTANTMGIDMADALIAKNRYNAIRADHKLSARAAGGKKY